ncbi:hypothetical protein EGW08_014621 [Elysia chlorotica]|uniref:Histone deacetylase 8 n=1 Tax=Elysia chlorotica TaxID=188477 RepID=A0A433T7P7_ELYCH|nr:hypothetical protein EGW08_014621 [Elysia chlorotica]
MKEKFLLAEEECSRNVLMAAESGGSADTCLVKNSAALSNKRIVTCVDNDSEKEPIFLPDSQQTAKDADNTGTLFDETKPAKKATCLLAQEDPLNNSVKQTLSNNCDESFFTQNSVLPLNNQEIVTFRDNNPQEDYIFLPCSEQSDNVKVKNPMTQGEAKLGKETDNNSPQVHLHSVSIPSSECPIESNMVVSTPYSEFNYSTDFKTNDEYKDSPSYSCRTSEKGMVGSCGKQRNSPGFEQKLNASDTHFSCTKTMLIDDMEAKDTSLPDKNPAHSNLNLIKVSLDNNISKVKKFDDPFELFSDDDMEQKRYQPIKRKLAQTLTSDQNIHYSATEPVEKMLEAPTIDMEGCKKLKLNGRVSYIHSDELLRKVNRLIRIEGRADLVHSLIQAYGLLQYVDVVPPRLATEAEVLGFHSSDYIDFLRDVSTVSDVEESLADQGRLNSEAEAFGLSYDCPLQDGIFETASLIGGASIVAADTLISGRADIAINWYGGWHHAKRDSASGFCYINDIVLAILKLREKFDKILYVDIDLHHGDGVEEAFSVTSKVMTVSFHKHASGFFPGSGAINNVGLSRGKFYAVNIPLQDGITDAQFCSVFFRVMKMIKDKFSPEAVVLQCGADGLSEDRMASFNLTHLGIAKCVCFMLTWNLPTLLLGGGGYNFASTAKCWTYLTALVSRRKLPEDIPDHENLLAYGPDYQISTSVGNRRDCNSKQYLINLIAKISRNLENL